MFYQGKVDDALRFGDVVKGYILTNAILDKPNWEGNLSNYSVSISSPPFSVIMTPCCSIEDKIIVLTPLIPVLASFFDNPYLAEDLTRINHPMSPQQAVPPRIWEMLGEQERQKRLAEGTNYAFINLFVYNKDDSFPQYPLNKRMGDNITTNYHMVDFKNLYKVYCNKIITPKNSPLESKHIQLSIETREDLRTKMAYYYTRVPVEDQLQEG